MIFYRW